MDKDAKKSSDELAKELAQGLIDSSEKRYQKVFIVTRQDEPVDDQVVVVIAVQTNRNGAAMSRKLSEPLVIKAVAGPSGQICPVCNGTGKVSF